MIKHCLCLSLLLAVAPANAQSTSEDASADEHIQISYRQAYRGDVASSDIPQAIETLDASLVQDVNATRFRDLLTFSPSIALQNDGGGLWDSYSLRGFPGNENMPSGFLINGFDGGRGFSGHRDVSNIAYVELLKGPGSALYGRSDPGGIINVTTRKPQYQPEGYIKATAGSDDRYRIEGDYTSGLTDTLAFRVNGAVQEYGSFRDYVNSHKKVLTPSLRWQVQDDTSLLYEFEYLQQSQLFDRGIVVLDNNLDTVPFDRYLGEPGDSPTDINARGHQLTFEHHLQNNWLWTGGVSHRTSSLSGYSSDAELAPSRQQLFEDGRTLTRQRRFRDYDSTDTSGRLELSGNVDALGVKHHLLIGADAYDYELYTLLERIRPEPGTYELDILEPQYGAVTPPTPLPLYENAEEQQGVGLYVQNQIALSEAWRLLLGLRFDRFRQDMDELTGQVSSARTDSRISPRLGLTYKATPRLSLYTSYSEGFLPLSGTDYLGNGFEPEESESFEVGLKWRRAGLKVQAAIFDATKTNILTSDPVNIGFPAPLGAATSRGIELDISQEIGRNTELRLGYAYLDTKTKNNVVNLDWGTSIPAGSELVNVPEHTFNLFAKHYLQDLGIDGHVGARFRYVDERLGDSVRPDYRLPAYSLVDVFFAYQLSERSQLQLNIDNLLDEAYLANSYAAFWTTPGNPRQFSLSVRYGF